MYEPLSFGSHHLNARDLPSTADRTSHVVCIMDRKLSLPVQELVRAHERLIRFASDHDGLPEDDCEAVLFLNGELRREIEKLCAERHHKHDSLAKRVA